MQGEAEPRSQPAPVIHETPQEEEKSSFSELNPDPDELLRQELLRARGESDVELLGS